MLGGRRNPETGELEIYEMTPDETAEALNRITRWLAELTAMQAHKARRRRRLH
jgi:hypothetical protein